MHDERRDDPRLSELRTWLREGLRFGEFELAPASADASFRRYFRVTRPGGSLIVMDAPPGKEDVGPYLRVAEMLRRDRRARAARARAQHRGRLPAAHRPRLAYVSAGAGRRAGVPMRFTAMRSTHSSRSRCAATRHAKQLPPYDEKLLRFEMSLFPDWLLTRHLGLALDADEAAKLAQVMDLLTESTRSRNRGCSCTATITRGTSWCVPAEIPGILDFQDAVRGPLDLRPRLAAPGLLHRLARRAGGVTGSPRTAGGPKRRAWSWPAKTRNSCAGST